MYDSIISRADTQYAVIGQAIRNASAVGNNPFIEIIKRYGQQILIIILSVIGAISLFYRDHSSRHYQTLRLFIFPFTLIMVFMIAMVGAQGFHHGNTISKLYYDNGSSLLCISHCQSI